MNYWIVQSNPRKFPIIIDIGNAFSSNLPEGYERMSYWPLPKIPVIPQSIRPGDIVFVWKSDGAHKGTRGIYAKAKVYSVWPQRSKRLTPDRIDAVRELVGLNLGWYDSKAKAKNQVYPTIVIEYIRNLIKAPLKVNKIKRVLELKDLVILKCWRRTLYHLTEEQGRMLDEMTGGSETGSATKETKSESHGMEHDYLKEMGTSLT